MTASGQMTFYTDPTISDPSIITPGPDRNMWFTNNTGPSVSRITTTAVPWLQTRSEHCQQGSRTVTEFRWTPGTAHVNFVHRVYTIAGQSPEVWTVVV